ncbi:undecaprenyldiphospho-muramoylpentapeptide beta-N-acetylglucosaminyltransferase [Sphingoaurantiacus capsulatus]|uniref:UDP-N-acetylglucosamine--N-acetylmuramyl-(pentapeptide) pyrophosphoryl-undecaprenol N-acetylglucosamine transferase n=1 Tax=Sphingoaurantiacus capsulatus TaxID=1771310 RepID=A0ABV7XCS4_9SPHN
MAKRPHLVIAAGGTGGHMVPGHVLAETMTARGYDVSLITDDRGVKYPGLFDGCPRHVVPSGSLGGLNPIGWAKALLAMAKGRAAVKAIYRQRCPVAVIGFGGYPTVPALLGAFAAKVPTVIHDSNTVLGRVNRMLAGRVDVIATAFPNVHRLAPRHAAKVALVGNPVRADIVALRDLPFPDATGPLHILVIGGSQGATVLSKVVPAAIDRLPADLKARLRVTQQCRPEDIEGVRAAYAAAGVPADLATFLQDMPERLASAHLVIARSGASTVSELAVAGRPAIFVPLPTATDNHQVYNAQEMVDAGGARMILQSDFTAETVSAAIAQFLADPAALNAAATAARSTGRPDAAERLGDIVEGLGKRGRIPASGGDSSLQKASA